MAMSTTDPRVSPPQFHDLADPPGRVLTIVAHPDDIDFGTAGTQARLVQAGSQVTYCLLTSGEAGMPEDLDREAVRNLRESEQTAAAAAVGVTDVRFLRLPDGRLVADLDLRRDISRVIRQVRPDLIICQSPERRWDSVYASHPDHLAAGEATIAAVYPDARNPHAHVELLDEGLEPHSVPEVWVTSLEPLDVFIDIAPVFDMKCDALSAHASQVSERFNVRELLGTWAADLAGRFEFAEGSKIEAYRRIVTA